MTTKTSTGLRNYMLGVGSVKSALDGKIFRFFGGDVPESADDSVGAATLLSEIMASGTDGVTFDETSINNGSISKLASELWQTGPGGNEATGTATFYRLVDPADDGSEDATAIRIQGGIAVSGSEINLTDPDLEEGDPQSLNFFNVVMPSNGQFSRGLRDALMVEDCFAVLMDGCQVGMFDGTLTTPEADYSGATLLSLIKNGADGVTWAAEDVANGVLSKTVSEVWNNSAAGGNSDSGDARMFILYHPDDDLTASTTRRRVVGTIGNAGEILNMSNTNLVALAPQSINSFTVAIPTM